MTSGTVFYAIDLTSQAAKWQLDLGALVDFCSPAVDGEGWAWVGTEDGTCGTCGPMSEFGTTQLNPGTSIFSAIAFGPDGRDLLGG